MTYSELNCLLFMEWIDKIISNTFYASLLILVFLFLFVGLSFLNSFSKKKSLQNLLILFLPSFPLISSL